MRLLAARLLGYFGLKRLEVDDEDNSKPLHSLPILPFSNIRLHRKSNKVRVKKVRAGEKNVLVKILLNMYQIVFGLGLHLEDQN